MAITIETPQGTDALTEFVLFQDAVYAERSARWPALPPLQLPMLAGESPFTAGRTLHPLLARDGGRILARALALLDGRYNRHWNERLGHVLMFEARPGTREAVRRAGCEIVPLAEVPEARRAAEFTELWNDGFKAHWGYTPFSEAEIALLLSAFAPTGVLDTSVMAYRAGRPVGALWVGPETTAGALLAPGRVLTDAEKLNFLGIAVRESDRGRGVNLAMSACAYLELVRRGARYVSYTLVLDDNWPSRRTAEKLGAEVCASYLVYRRNFRR